MQFLIWATDGWFCASGSASAPEASHGPTNALKWIFSPGVDCPGQRFVMLEGYYGIRLNLHTNNDSLRLVRCLIVQAAADQQQHLGQ